MENGRFKRVTIPDLENDGWTFTPIEGGYNCSIIQKDDKIHVFRGRSAGSGEVDFSNSTEFDKNAIKFFNDPRPENNRKFVN